MAATNYAYRVRDKSGKVTSGEIEGSSTTAVAKALRDRGMVPLQIEEKKTSVLQMELKLPGFGKRVKTRDIVLFSRQFATMVNAGLSLIRALTVLEERPTVIRCEMSSDRYAPTSSGAPACRPPWIVIPRCSPSCSSQ